MKEAALDEGAVAFLSKPLDLEKVIQLINEVNQTAILVVEDDAGIAGLPGTSLKQQGYSVTVTKSPHDALELVEQIRFDLIFVDVSLPAMNGPELYLAIKRITPTAVAIMMAGMEEEFERIAREAVRRNAYAMVRKPLDIATFSASWSGSPPNASPATRENLRSKARHREERSAIIRR